jgi:hypothetical protein
MSYKSYMFRSASRKEAVRHNLFRCGLALALLFFACDMLPTDEFEPTGSQFNGNPAIEVVSITGHPDLSPNGPFTMGMTIVSLTSGVESDELPAGLLLRRRVNNTQHMLLLKPHPIATDTIERLMLLGAFCCNKLRASPDIGDTFDIGPVTDNDDLQEIASLVRNKDISSGTDMWMVQRAVYMVTDSTGLTQAYVDSLTALPDETTY